MRRAFVAMVSLVGILVTAGVPPARAMTVRHETSSFDATIQWSCPGRDPVEHYTETTHSTTYSVDGQRVRVIDHVGWRGWIVNRETGALLRDAANWNDVYTYRGKRIVKIVTTGVIWRLTVPGHGIIVHQSGRQVFERGDEPDSTPFMEAPDIQKLCSYV
jgi:hypothetical protein